MWSLEHSGFDPAAAQLPALALLAACTLALLIGSRRPAAVAAVVVAARVAAGVAAYAGLWSPAAALILDGLLLAALLPLAVLSRPLWTLFAAAFQVLVVATRGAGLLEPTWSTAVSLHVWTACLGLALAAGAIEERSVSAGRAGRSSGSSRLRC